MWTDAGRPVETVTPLWCLKSLTWGVSSRFPLVNHFDLPVSEPLFGLSQGPLVCVCVCVCVCVSVRVRVCISQPRWIPVERPVGSVASLFL